MKETQGDANEVSRVGLLDRFLRDDDSAAEKLDRLRRREDELEGDLEEAQQRLSSLESEIAEATAAGADDRIEDGRQERSELRDEIADLEAALEVVGQKIDELAPDLLRERLGDLADDYRRSYDHAEDELAEFAKHVDRALSALARFDAQKQGAVEASGRMQEIVSQLEDAGQHAERPVETTDTGKRLFAGVPRFARYAAEELRGTVAQSWRSENE